MTLSPSSSLAPAALAPTPKIFPPGPASGDDLIALALDGVVSPHSKRAYAHALGHFRAWCALHAPRAQDKAVVQQYRASLEAAGLSPSTINVRLSAIRKVFREAADNGLCSQEHVASIGRVKGAPRRGTRTGNWLDRAHAERLLALPDRETTAGKRDRALLCLLVGCGLRREELAALELASIAQRDGRWVLVDLVGKGKRVRTVPMPPWAKAAVDDWIAAAGITAGRLLRPVNKGGRVTGQGITAQAVFGIVVGYGGKLGLPIAPHDLRRTYAKLAHKGHSPIEQIQISLGHSSIQTTERYLGVEQDLTDAPCDHLGLRL